MKNRLLLAGLMVCFLFSFTYAQDKLNIKFGKIKPEDFDLSSHTFDSSAAAVVIADMGDATFEVNNKGYFDLIFRRHTRIKILKNSAFDLGTVSVPFYYANQGEERVTDIKGYTYNLEGGKVVESKMDSKSVFKDKLDDHWNLKKFTLTNIKEGSIIEYTYTITSDYYSHLRSWSFQGEYPVFWSEYNVAIPEYFDYVFLSQGYQPFFINSSSNTNQSFSITEGGVKSLETVNVLMTGHRYVMKEVPALKTEAFTSTIQNHIAKIEFQLSRISFPGVKSEDYLGTWTSLKELLLDKDNFGADIKRNNNWLDDEMPAITKGAKTDLEKLTRIYSFVRDNFVCTDETALFTTNSLKTVFKNRSGNVAEINLLLVAMLRHEKIKADPLILSTRSNGLTNEIYPLITRYNYVIADARIDGKEYELDASEPMLAFNHLDPKCYNGHARVVNDNMEAVYILPDSVREKKITLVTIRTTPDGKLAGSFESSLGYAESLKARTEIKKQGQAGFFKNLFSSINSEIELTDKNVDSLSSPDDPLTLKYNFDLGKADQDIIYFTPVLSDGLKKNYFSSAQRFYPIEMPYTLTQTYILNMEIPKGYEIDELPKSARATLNDEEGVFEYLVGKNENMIQLKYTLKLNRATFSPDDYNSLREFYGLVVKKQAEQIVFKKKK